MKNLLIKLMIMGGMLIGLPVLGAMLAGYPAVSYLEFPPKTRFIIHAPFSWIAFAVFSLLILLCVIPFVVKGVSGKTRKHIVMKRPFPWWGWPGIFLLIVLWVLAWTRFSFFVGLQEYTFIPLWLFYILIVNAIAYRQTGHCLMLNRPVYFLLLFPVSAAFWWFFEYLNRFVQNWYYVGVNYSPVKYFLLATISFSTVLPAVLGTRDLLMSTNRIKEGFQKFHSVRPGYPRVLAMLILLLSAIGLGCIGIFSDYLFPLLWVSPLLIILSLQTLFKEKHILSDIADGNWSIIVASSVSALICGIFWEMWNYYSLAKWEYSIPLVHRFKIFEMPLLGYAGYLPFGLECAVVGDMFMRLLSDRAKE